MSAGVLPFPVQVIHHKGHADRRRYLDAQFHKHGLTAHYVDAFDPGEFPPDTFRFDEARFREMIDAIRGLVIGYVLGAQHLKNLPFANCVALHAREGRSLDQDIAEYDWLRPRPLNAAEVSVFLKHRDAWKRLAAGEQEWGVIVEDDLMFGDTSVAYLRDLCARLPDDADFIDFAGGLGLTPRIGNRVVNENFLLIEPPKERTLCGVIMRRRLAQALLALDPPLCLPVDWTLTWAFGQIGTRVYWVHPPAFGHGSAMGVYPSSTDARRVQPAWSA
jgi:GR25 family glycosyltransferase involved in LPS biosynthesis